MTLIENEKKILRGGHIRMRLVLFSLMFFNDYHLLVPQGSANYSQNI